MVVSIKSFAVRFSLFASRVFLLVLPSTPAFAQRLPDNVVPSHYDIAVTPNLPSATFTGTERIAVTLKKPSSAIVLNAAEIAFDKVMIKSGETTQQGRVSLDAANEQATFTVDRAVAAGVAESGDSLSLKSRCVGPEVRGQDTEVFLSRLFGNADAAPLAWELLQARWDDLETKAGQVFGSPLLISSLGQFCDSKTRSEIEKFFATHNVPEAERTLQQALERISSCAELAAAQSPKLAEWLQRH